MIVVLEIYYPRIPSAMLPKFCSAINISSLTIFSGQKLQALLTPQKIILTAIPWFSHRNTLPLSSTSELCCGNFHLPLFGRFLSLYLFIYGVVSCGVYNAFSPHASWECLLSSVPFPVVFLPWADPVVWLVALFIHCFTFHQSFVFT